MSHETSGWFEICFIKRTIFLPPQSLWIVSLYLKARLVAALKLWVSRVNSVVASPGLESQGLESLLGLASWWEPRRPCISRSKAYQAFKALAAFKLWVSRLVVLSFQFAIHASSLIGIACVVRSEITYDMNESWMSHEWHEWVTNYMNESKISMWWAQE